MEMAMANAEIRTLVDGYFTMWNETDAAQRQAVIAAVWSDGARYVDPMFVVQGADELSAMVAGVHEQFPGHRFRLSGPIDAHHDRAHWEWELVGPDGASPIVSGVDFAVFAPDGRLSSVTGFFTQAPGAA